MDPIMEIPVLNLEDTTSGGGNESVSNDSVTGTKMTVARVVRGTKEERNLIRKEKRSDDIDYKSRIKRHTERENEIEQEFIPDRDQVLRRESNDDEKTSCEAFKSFEIPKMESSGPSFSSFENETKFNDKETRLERHLADKMGNRPPSSVTSSNDSRSSSSDKRNLQNESGKFCHSRSGRESQINFQNGALIPMSELRQQNFYLAEALRKVQETHAAERKRFNDIIISIDRALGTLPLRLERIRERNQRNLSIITSSRLQAGDGNQETGKDLTRSEESLTNMSQESSCYLSSRMICLLKKMDQLNEMIKTVKQGDMSPIEAILKSELYAISLLKKEIKVAKKQIDDPKTDTDISSGGATAKDNSIEDSASRAKSSFSNELNKAKNFKIFESHMILQDEALNLLTRKIKETEDALLKEVEAKEALKRENEAMAKEIVRLKSWEVDTNPKIEEKHRKVDRLKTDSLMERNPVNRPFRLIKELKEKLLEKEKILLAWKSKYSRLEAANSNKIILLENEKKKNSQLESAVKNLKSQNKSIQSQKNSFQYLSEQLKDQIEILKHQVEILAMERMKNQGEAAGCENKEWKVDESKLKAIEEEARRKLKEMQILFEKQHEDTKSKLKKAEATNKEFLNTFKELLNIINNYGIERDMKSVRKLSYSRTKEILQISTSELELLLNVYSQSAADKESENLYNECLSIVEEEDGRFSHSLSSWLFDVITEKLLHQSANRKDCEKQQINL